ncbi:MAG TPA: beta-1,6-N-acetylglucosaminyltransferase [Verrucomicrobiales bacterium]|nr:beta-1,6-N-acetylglucosaminyltransferase [Verrucomicrobiales bacterium]
MIFRRAMLAKAEAVFLFEDDVVFHPALAERLATLELPDDWGVFYLGCQHHERPEVVAPGLVRVTAPLDTHAWGVRADHFMEVRRALTGKYWPWSGSIPASDILLAELVRRVPSYAAYPNLVWQQEEESDLTGGVYGNYEPDGLQRLARTCLSGVLAECLGGTPHVPGIQRARQGRAFFWPPALWQEPPPVTIPEKPPEPLTSDGRVAFLFLTRGPHLTPDLWEEYWRGYESRVSVHGHAKERHWPAAPGRHDWLREAQIPDHIPTEWGDISLVYAQLALLKAALRQPENRFFLFASESCIPVRPLNELLRLLSIDGRSRFNIEDWWKVDSLNPWKSGRASPAGPIPPREWRWHPQWMLLSREAAELIVANEKLIACFHGTHAPDEAAFGTLLHIAGYPLEQKVAKQNVTWTRWESDIAANPDLITSPTPAVMGDIAGSGCFFARKFPAESPVGLYGMHR